MDDLFFQMKLAETAKHLGIEVKVASSEPAFLELLSTPAELAIFDLNARNNPLQVAEKVRAAHPELRMISFLSHVQVDLAAKAKSIGFNDVMPRSRFTVSLPEILGAAKNANA